MQHTDTKMDMVLFILWIGTKCYYKFKCKKKKMTYPKFVKKYYKK